MLQEIIRAYYNTTRKNSHAALCGVVNMTIPLPSLATYAWSGEDVAHTALCARPAVCGASRDDDDDIVVSRLRHDDNVMTLLWIPVEQCQDLVATLACHAKALR